MLIMLSPPLPRWLCWTISLFAKLFRAKAVPFADVAYDGLPVGNIAGGVVSQAWLFGGRCTCDHARPHHHLIVIPLSRPHEFEANLLHNMLLASIREAESTASMPRCNTRTA